jgi:hypothetical protein
MPEKNFNLSVHKINWNSQSKLNFAKFFKQIDIHILIKLECTLEKKRKNF